MLFFKLCGTLFLANKDNGPVAVVHLLLHGTCQILTMSAIFFYDSTSSELHCSSLTPWQRLGAICMYKSSLGYWITLKTNLILQNELGKETEKASHSSL